MDETSPSRNSTISRTLENTAPNIRLVCFNGQGSTEAMESLTRLNYQTIALPSSSGANRRSKKIALIESANQAWIDLSREWYDVEPADCSRALDRMDS